MYCTSTTKLSASMHLSAWNRWINPSACTINYRETRLCGNELVFNHLGTNMMTTCRFFLLVVVGTNDRASLLCFRAKGKGEILYSENLLKLLNRIVLNHGNIWPALHQFGFSRPVSLAATFTLCIFTVYMYVLCGASMCMHTTVRYEAIEAEVKCFLFPTLLRFRL